MSAHRFTGAAERLLRKQEFCGSLEPWAAGILAEASGFCDEHIDAIADAGVIELDADLVLSLVVGWILGQLEVLALPTEAGMREVIDARIAVVALAARESARRSREVHRIDGVIPQ